MKAVYIYIHHVFIDACPVVQGHFTRGARGKEFSLSLPLLPFPIVIDDRKFINMCIFMYMASSFPLINGSYVYNIVINYMVCDVISQMVPIATRTV